MYVQFILYLHASDTHTEHQRRVFSMQIVVKWRSVRPGEVRKKRNEITQVRQIFYQRPNSRNHLKVYFSMAHFLS